MGRLCTIVVSSEVVKARNDTENSAMLSRHPCNVHLILYNQNKKVEIRNEEMNKLQMSTSARFVGDETPR